MRLHDIKPAPGSHRPRKRLGRGTGSGTGTTAGKGTKGQKARSGGAKAGFRGMSSRNQRLAKRPGFNNRSKVYFQVVNVERLNRFEAGSIIEPASLYVEGFADDGKGPIKILGNGELNVALRFEGVRVTGSARQKIEAAGGSIAQSDAVESEASAATSQEEPGASSGA